MREVGYELGYLRMVIILRGNKRMGEEFLRRGVILEKTRGWVRRWGGIDIRKGEGGTEGWRWGLRVYEDFIIEIFGRYVKGLVFCVVEYKGILKVVE